MYEAIVVGGGLVGMSIAYHLVQAGAKTLLIDRHDPGRATDAGAGIVAAATIGSNSAAWFNFAVEAAAYYPLLSAQLQSEQAGDTGYARCGELVVAVSEDELEPFEAAQSFIFARQQRRGQPSSADLQLVSPSEACDLFPALAPVQRALYDRQAARVDGRLLSQALRRAAEQRGLRVQNGSVERLLLKNQVVTGVAAAGEMLGADRVVIAGGAWSPAFEQQLGRAIPVWPQRGQLVHLKLPGVETNHWPVVTAFHGHYLVAWPDSRVVAGATHEEAGFHPQPTAAGLHEVLSEALRVAPGLAQAELGEIRVGLRPRTVDGLPLIGPTPGAAQLYLATGHGATGLHLGPYTGKVVAELMLGQDTQADLTAFDPARFGWVA